MSEYKIIKGFKIQVVAADPSTDLGQVWYNSTTSVLKYNAATAAGAWATGGNMGTARYGLAGAGTQTAGLAFAGNSGGVTNATEEYDGSAWTAGGDTTKGRFDMGAAGTQTAGLIAGGDAGQFSSPSYYNGTEEYGGSSWTAGGDLGTGRKTLGGFGTQTAALVFVGNIPAATAISEHYDGTSWTAGGNYPAATSGAKGAGTQTAGLATGAGPGSTASNLYDGTSWSATTATSTSYKQHAMGGLSPSSASIVFGGGNAPSRLNATEEFTGPGIPLVKTVEID
tara:strand:+ start:53 stop:898 length:846 start_codon:yes stop_codon:yes gene_type:complete